VPEDEVRVAEVKAFKTKSGSTRFVLVDDKGEEYSTFKEQIASKLAGLEGKRVRITYHEQERDGFTNVYLDDVQPLEPEEAAPYLLSLEARDVPPRELFEQLQPFKELAAEDIDRNGDEGG
jgi:hypothetical protein